VIKIRFFVDLFDEITENKYLDINRLVVIMYEIVSKRKKSIDSYQLQLNEYCACLQKN